MGAPAELRLAWDGGHTDGDPGSGRVRIDAASPRRAKFVYVNARDSEDATLDRLVPSWQLGDVLVIERPGAETNRIVAWITGPIGHGGSYYRVPVIVRSVFGNFAAHDECVLTHQPNMTIDADASPRALDVRPMARIGGGRATDPPPVPRPVLDRVSATDIPATPALGETAPLPSERGDCAQLRGEIARLAAENAELLGILQDLMTDDREVYVIEG